MESAIDTNGGFNLGGLTPGLFVLLIIGEHGILASRTLTIPYIGPPLEVSIKDHQLISPTR